MQMQYNTHLVFVSNFGMVAVSPLRGADSGSNGNAVDIAAASLRAGSRSMPNVSRIICWSALRMPLRVMIAWRDSRAQHWNRPTIHPRMHQPQSIEMHPLCSA